MKIDKNAPGYPMHATWFPDGRPFHSGQEGIPIRLEIASRILAGGMAIAGSHHRFDGYGPGSTKSDCAEALKIADALIESHNETSGE